MTPVEQTRAEIFLMRYRQFEGLLERRFAGRNLVAASVVKEYLRDPDSEPVRSDIELCREIRNILSHNADPDGSAVVEPSAGVLAQMQAVIEYVKRPQLAIQYGTLADRILFAHPNDLAINVMRHMMKMGYSHVPVADRSGLVGVFSSDSLMLHAAKKGLSEVRDELRIGDMREAISFGDERGERYVFLRKDATLQHVRDAFQRRQERNHRLAVVFLTEDGARSSEVRAMLTPWDALREDIAVNRQE